MKYLHTYITLILLFIMLTGCEDAFETTLEIDPPEHTPQLAIHAFGTTYDNSLSVFVSETVGLLDNLGSASIDNAEVSLSKNGEVIQMVWPMTPSGSSRFNYYMPEGLVTFEKGAEYEITVKANGYPTARATSIVPNDVTISKLEFEEDGSSDEIDLDVSEIEITFQDPAGENNYYEASGAVPENNNVNEDFDEIFTDTFDPAATAGIAYNAVIIEDTSFDGEQKTMSFSIDKFSQEQAEESLFFQWRVTTKAHFLFNKTAASQDEQDGNPFASPVQIFSNVSGGVGIFSIVNESFVKVID